MPQSFLQRVLALLYGVYATLALALVILPLSVLIIIAPTLGLRRAIGRAGVKLAMAVIGQPLHISGLQHLPPGACVCVANHASYVDGLVLTAALPARFTFLVQHRAASWPLIGMTIRRMGVSFVNRWSAREAALATRELLKRLQAGESFTIFAEGTFEPEPGLLSFHSGAFVIACKAGVPVAPAVIRGTRQLYGAGSWLPRWSRLEIEVLPAISADSSTRGTASDTRHAANALRDQVRAAILARCGEPDAGHAAHAPSAL